MSHYEALIKCYPFLFCSVKTYSKSFSSLWQLIPVVVEVDSLTHRVISTRIALKCCLICFVKVAEKK